MEWAEGKGEARNIGVRVFLRANRYIVAGVWCAAYTQYISTHLQESGKGCPEVDVVSQLFG